MGRVILASGSPRRRELLLRFDIAFDVMASDVDEEPEPGEAPDAFARRAARDKCRSVADRLTEGVVIGADTVVALGNAILGKPGNAAEARAMLGRLSGRWHRVVTGLAVVNAAVKTEHVDSAVTRVKFSRLDPRTIDAYVATGEPMDKAGAYGIQGFGGILVERIDGCYYNVVGLPLNLLAGMLLRERIRLM